jgi:tRNA(Arg) A34 adenosine deaminase TadA
MVKRDFNEARASLEPAAWRALEKAFEALVAGGLPCGAALADGDANIIADGRNHAYDPRSGNDLLEGTPLAHAELNVLARIPTDRDVSGDTLWSTQQPCSMCAAAIEFCGVGRTRFLAADPAFAGTADPRAGEVVDPTVADPGLGEWTVLANVIFLQPTIRLRGSDHERIRLNSVVEPEITDLAVALSDDLSLHAAGGAQFAAVVADLWPMVSQAAARRGTRLDR